jgi:hypothetical protein
MKKLEPDENDCDLLFARNGMAVDGVLIGKWIDWALLHN